MWFTIAYLLESIMNLLVCLIVTSASNLLIFPIPCLSCMYDNRILEERHFMSSAENYAYWSLHSSSLEFADAQHNIVVKSSICFKSKVDKTIITKM